MGPSPYRHFSKEGLSVHPNPYFSNRQRAKSQGGEKLRLKRGLLQIDQESRTKNQRLLQFDLHSKVMGGEGVLIVCACGSAWVVRATIRPSKTFKFDLIYEYVEYGMMKTVD
ncbi:sensor histidine kinase [Sesbania bispinosa]|nr:sensor histidine kinase [Sesbania bispinosa]